MSERRALRLLDSGCAAVGEEDASNHAQHSRSRSLVAQHERGASRFEAREHFA